MKIQAMSVFTRSSQGLKLYLISSDGSVWIIDDVLKKILCFQW
jgi:hypothetical protein